MSLHPLIPWTTFGLNFRGTSCFFIPILWFLLHDFSSIEQSGTFSMICRVPYCIMSAFLYLVFTSVCMFDDKLLHDQRLSWFAMWSVKLNRLYCLQDVYNALYLSCCLPYTCHMWILYLASYILYKKGYCYRLYTYHIHDIHLSYINPISCSLCRAFVGVVVLPMLYSGARKDTESAHKVSLFPCQVNILN